MREVNEMYLGLNTLRDRFGIGPLIKNHSEGELMRRDRVRSERHIQHSGSRGPSGSIQELSLRVIIRHEKATDLQLNTPSGGVSPPKGSV